jgi:hypothetical protein
MGHERGGAACALVLPLGLPAVAALLLAAVALATEARRLSRRDVAGMLRAD